MSTPDTVRLPPRYKGSSPLLGKPMRELDREAIRKAFCVWDFDCDGRVRLEDLMDFVERLQLIPPKDGWNLAEMVDEAIARTGFAKPVGKKACNVLTVPDVIAACSFRVIRKQPKPRPFRDLWIVLIKAAIRDPIFAAPLPEIFAPPLMTHRERQALMKVHGPFSCVPRNKLPASLHALEVFNGIPQRPVTADAVLLRKVKNGCDGRFLEMKNNFFGTRCGFNERDHFMPPKKRNPSPQIMPPSVVGGTPNSKASVLRGPRNDRPSTTSTVESRRIRPGPACGSLATAQANLQPRFVVAPVRKDCDPAISALGGSNQAEINYSDLQCSPLYDRVATHPTIVAYHHRF